MRDNRLMRIIFAGTPEVAVPSLEALVEAGHTVLAVITREDAPLGRKRILTPSPVAQAADRLGLDVIKANRLDSAVTERVAGLAPELGVVVAYGGLIREPLLTLPRHGWINLHFSDLPRWRGAAPVQRALMAGETEIGLAVFSLVAALDAGDVLALDTATVLPGTSADRALTQLAAEGTVPLLRAVADLAAGTAQPRAQVGEASYAHKLEREDGRLDLRGPAAAVLAHWAGVTPEPGAFVTLAEDPTQAVKLLSMRAPTQAESDASAAQQLAERALPAGTAALLGNTAVLATGAGFLILDTLQPAGKPRMAANDWLRGRGGEVRFA